MLTRIFNRFRETRWHYKCTGAMVRVLTGGSFSVAPSAKIIHATVFVNKDSSLTIAEGVQLTNVNLYVKGHVTIGAHTTLSDGTYTIDEGSLIIGHHTRLSLRRIWVRFGGKVEIGDYTNINDRSEIRSDECVQIGSYCQISYDINIWDTNTHKIYPTEKRRVIAEKYWPYFGKEVERPVTKPIVIGNDCWIGEKASILKGTTLGDGTIVGYNTLISNKTIPAGSKVIQKAELTIIQ